MPNLYVIGSSHAVKILRIMEHKHKFKEKFTLVNMARSGARYEDLRLPDPSKIRSNDVIFFQAFGNDIMKKNIRMEEVNGKRIIHLEKFEPYDLSIIESKIQIFKEFCAKVPCRVIILDLITRHINCCKMHRYRGYIAFQRSANKKLRTILGKLKNVTIVQFLKNLGHHTRWLKKTSNLAKVYADSVHLKTSFYEKILERIERIVFTR
jgi:hypothetical protein